MLFQVLGLRNLTILGNCSRTSFLNRKSFPIPILSSRRFINALANCRFDRRCTLLHAKGMRQQSLRSAIVILMVSQVIPNTMNVIVKCSIQLLRS